MKEDEVIYSEISDFTKYCPEYLKIKNKRGEIVPFVFNPAQKKINDIVQEAEKAGRLLRFIILKARQEGVSTYYEGKIFHETSTEFNVKSSIIGHEQTSADNLFDMFNRYYDNLPEQIRPIKKYSNRKELSFEKLQSEISISSADSGEKLKRSDTIQKLHCTEVAFWRDAKGAMLALLQTVPDEMNTLVVIESTANGLGGWFYNTWKNAVSGKNEFIPIFLAWFELPDYSRKFNTANDRANLIKTLSSYEKELIKKHNLTFEQINWYRYTLENKCSGDTDQMMQEYPSTPDEAFITSGRPVFNAKICKQNYLNAEEPVMQGDLIEVKGEIEFVENPKGFIKVFDEITVGFVDYDELNVFAGGCDVAEGLEQQDYSVIKVLDRRSRKVVLTWHGHIDADMLAEEQIKIQKWLKGQLYICTEYNNHGLTTISNAFRLHVNQYYRNDYQKGIEMPKDAIGFKTTQTTKPYIINGLIEQIREGYFVEPEQEAWDECLTFVKDSKGRMSAQNKMIDPGIKCFDDRVMALALMFECDRWMPQYKKVEKVNLNKIPYPHIYQRQHGQIKLHDRDLRF